jgi:hypothetical protein
MLPLDTSISNTENALNFQHFQTLNLEQTQRLMSRIQLANYFKQQCFEVIGITPQRLGQQIGQTQTATGIEQAVAGSYAQTEKYFIQHSDYLMPRVHQMRTDLAQYYQSTKPSLRLQYMTSTEEKVNFEINGTDLLLRDINIYCTTKTNHRAIIEQMKQLAISNNTAGASIYDLGNIIQSDSLAEVNHVLKAIDKKTQKNRQEDMAHQEKLKQMEVEQKTMEEKMKIDHETMENEKSRRKDVLVAQIRAAAMTAMPKSDEEDFTAAMDNIERSDEFQQTMNFQNSKEATKNLQSMEKNQLAREKMQADLTMKKMDIDIAKENKTKAELIASKKLKESQNKKKK